MLCRQCEQTLNGEGCLRSGVCGKTGQVSAVSDLLTACLKRLARGARAKRQAGRPDRAAGRILVKALAGTQTNTIFDASRLSDRVTDAQTIAFRMYA